MNSFLFHPNKKVSLTLSGFILVLFFIAFQVLATPPGSKYTPGETLDPSCQPGDTNCTVQVGDLTQATSGTQAVGQIPFYTATGKELSKGSTSLFWDSAASLLGIGTNTPTASLEIEPQPGGVSPLRILGFPFATAENLGVTAGSIDILLNKGGNISGGLAVGNGGGISILTGAGGNGSGVTQGGEGGTVAILSSDGGTNGGNAGNISIGTGDGKVSTFGDGGDGGAVYISTGTGGDAGNGLSENGNGGDITLAPGTGITAGTGINGRDGNVILVPGSGKVGIGLGGNGEQPDFTLHVKGDDGSGVVAKFESNSAGTCSLNAGSGELSCTSDETLKKNIENIGEALANILALRPVSYIWKTEDEGDAKTKYGFLAQEVEEHIPSVVTTDKTTGLKSLSMQGFIPYIVKAIQELNAKVDAISGQTATVVQSVVSAVLEKLTVGSADHPTGITLFDKSTGEPYCVSINNGAVEPVAGECE